jgi:hypothetical protein
MKSLLFTAILSLRKRSEQILIKFAIPLQVRLTHAQTFFRGVLLNSYSIRLCYCVQNFQCRNVQEMKRSNVKHCTPRSQIMWNVILNSSYTSSYIINVDQNKKRKQNPRMRRRDCNQPLKFAKDNLSWISCISVYIIQ